MWRWCLAIILCSATPASGYGVGPAIALEELAKKADVIVKGTVTAIRKVTNTQFDVVAGYTVHEAELRVVSTVKVKPAKTV
jgi:hypothetical protein